MLSGASSLRRSKLGPLVTLTFEVLSGEIRCLPATLVTKSCCSNVLLEGLWLWLLTYQEIAGFHDGKIKVRPKCFQELWDSWPIKALILKPWQIQVVGEWKGCYLGRWFPIAYWFEDEAGSHLVCKLSSCSDDWPFLNQLNTSPCWSIDVCLLKFTNLHLLNLFIRIAKIYLHASHGLVLTIAV